MWNPLDGWREPLVRTSLYAPFARSTRVTVPYGLLQLQRQIVGNPWERVKQ